MPTWFQPIPISSGDASAWLKVAPENSFRVIKPEEAPTPLSRDLLAKCDAVLIMRSGSKDQEFVVANLYRRDKGKIDQMPFGTAFVSGSKSAGLLTHHGDWAGRTVSGSDAPPAYREISEGNATVCDQSFATLAMPEAPTGSIFDLTPKSNIGAFQRVLDELIKAQA